MSEAPMTPSDAMADAIRAAEAVSMTWPSSPGLESSEVTVSAAAWKKAVDLSAFILQHRGDWQPPELAPMDTEVLTYRRAGLQAVAVLSRINGRLDWCVTDGMRLLDVIAWKHLGPSPAIGGR